MTLRAPPNRILVFEDDPAARAGVVRLLARDGYLVAEAESGARGVEEVLAFRPDLILSDVDMPEVDGIELCRRLRASPVAGGTLFVFLSAARTGTDQQAEGLDAGADGYIARPVGNRELLARVGAMMRLKRAEEERDRVIKELQFALVRVRQLSDLLSVCMHCSRVRTEAGEWRGVEELLGDQSEPRLSHGLCPDCAKEHFPGV
jgi:DNA-binding response OmpR family regulator